MRYFYHLVRKYPFSCLVALVIWILSLYPITDISLPNIKFADKWTHIVMYLGFCLVIWAEYLWKHQKTNWRKTMTWAWFAPVLMGGVLELLQAYCTGGHRSGEWLDFVANTTGCTLALLIGILAAKCLSKG